MSDVGGVLADLAGGLSARAAALRATAEAPIRSLAASGWNGSRSQDLMLRLAQRQRVFEDLADECERLAGQCHGMADDYAAQVRRMHQYEQEVRSWIRIASPDSLAAFGLANQLPDDGSPQWAEVLIEARRAGASL